MATNTPLQAKKAFLSKPSDWDSWFYIIYKKAEAAHI